MALIEMAKHESMYSRNVAIGEVSGRVELKLIIGAQAMCWIHHDKRSHSEWTQERHRSDRPTLYVTGLPDNTASPVNLV